MRRRKMDAGLLILGTTGAFGLWSALNTSPTGLWKFVAKDGDAGTEKVARDAMNLSIVLVGAMSAGIFLLYGKRGWPAALGTGIAGVALYAYYDWLLKQGAAAKTGKPARYGLSTKNVGGLTAPGLLRT